MSLNIPPITITPSQPLQPLPDYPSAGVGNINGCEAITNVSNTGFLRVNSFSAAKLPNNATILAVAAQQSDLLLQPPVINDPDSTYDALELSRRISSRVYIVTCTMDNSSKSVSPVRDAKIVSFDSAKQNITIQVDADIYAFVKSEIIWVLDGEFGGKQFSIERKIAPNLFVVYPYNSEYVQPKVDSSWHYIAAGNMSNLELASSVPSVTKIHSLPYIEVNGLAVPAIRPQIATNENLIGVTSYYAYVIAEAPVDGINQLFFFSFKIGADFQVFLWKQVTFDGENRHAKTIMDSHGNLHVTWESSRCQPGQVCYGVIGPGSRNIMNQTFISAVDKQADLFRKINTLSADDRFDKTSLTNYLTQSIVRVLPPVAIDLRAILDSHGGRGTMWYSAVSGSGTSSILDNANITVSGNPASDAFNARCILNHDENDIIFDGFFSQLSYQIFYNLTLSSLSVTELTDDDIHTLYASFKSQYSTLLGTAGFNFYTNNDNRYTISNPEKIFGNLIPLTQSVKLKGATPSATDKLRHFMLAALPEKVRFIATNTETLAQYAARKQITQVSAQATYVTQTEDVYYTGRYKLALLFMTSGDLNASLQSQKFHMVREFGDYFNFDSAVSLSMSVHYAKLRQEEANYIVSSSGAYLYNENAMNDGNFYDEYGVLKEDYLVRFAGNIIVTANGVVQGAESFIPDFSDLYRQFDIVLGALPGGQYPTIETTSYDGSLYENLTVSAAFRNIAIGPHTIVADPYQTSIALADRNVSQMIIKSSYNEDLSMNAVDETWNTADVYALNLGLNRTKIGLSSVPITFEGRCLSPSMALDYCDRAHFAFQSDRDGNWQIYYTGTVNPEMPFRFDTRITKTNNTAINPTIAVDKNGRRLIAWQDDRHGAYQIYAATSAKGLPCTSSRGLVNEISTEGSHIDDPYNPYNIFGSDICNVVFEFTNHGPSNHFVFSLDFYNDQETTLFKKAISSQSNISGWLVNGVQMPFNGAYIPAGQTVNIQYTPSAEDDISDEVYYIRILGNNTALDYLYIYYCPVEQTKKCTIPCIYTNSTNSPVTVNFRLSAYQDQALTKLVLTASTNTDQRKWVSDSNGFSASGLSVSAHETASVFYNPEVLPVELFMEQNSSSINSLLCGTTYWIKIESKIGSNYTTLDTFAFECSCNDVSSSIYRFDADSSTWKCSGQGAFDSRITSTNGNALFPNAAASHDGMIYVAWEDYRYKLEISDQKELSPGIYMCAYDCDTDTLYSSAQGSYDKRITVYSNSSEVRYYKPFVLVGAFQNPTTFFNSSIDIFRRSCSLFTSTADNTQIDEPINSGVFNESLQTLSSADVRNCLKFEIIKEDTINIYASSGDLPISAVDKPIVRFELVGPSGTYAVRFKNENETSWSDWLSILPELPSYPPINTYNLRGDGTLRSNFEAFFVGDNRFVAKWGLSALSGNKTVYCEILTYNGKTPIISLNVLALYKELKYKVELFSDAAMVTTLPVFGGYPVVSTKKLKSISVNSGSSSSSVSDVIIPNDVSSITRETDTLNTIYVKVTFDDPVALQNMLNLQSIQKYSSLSSPGASQSLSFNVLQQGLNAIYGEPLSLLTSGIYTGSFSIQQSDGVCNRDGLAVLVVNVPDLTSKIYAPDYNVDSIDPYNINKPALGDFYGAYTLVPEQTPENIKERDRTKVASNVVTLEEFAFKYNRDAFCSYISGNCINGNPPASDGYIHDTTDQGNSTTLVSIPNAAIPNPNRNDAPTS